MYSDYCRFLLPVCVCFMGAYSRSRLILESEAVETSRRIPPQPSGCPARLLWVIQNAGYYPANRLRRHSVEFQRDVTMLL